MIRPTIDAAIAFVLIVVAFFAAQALAPPIAADDTIPAPVYRVAPPATIAATVVVSPTEDAYTSSMSVPPAAAPTAVEAFPAEVTRVAVRGAVNQVTATVPPPARLPVDGDCESWRPLLAKYGIPYDEARPRMVRESGCSNAVNLNAGTGDASYGPLQVNRYGSLARWWDSGGYTLAVMSTPEGAIAAAAVLYHSCGWGPWDASRGYPCDGDYLRVPAPAWEEWAP